MPRDPRGQLVEREFLTLPVWDRLDSGMVEAVARSVGRCLPEPWEFTRVARHECGDQKRYVAFFDWNGVEFALIPGGETTLGWDRNNSLELTAEQGADWAGTRTVYELPALEEYLRQYMTPLRQCRIGPMLVEAAPAPNPAFGSEGTEEALQDHLDGGFRLPTADEWEYVCGAGSRTVWRWGNDTPQGYPGDYGRFHHFEAPRQANAFGLTFPSDGYQAEGVLDGGEIVARSGDGGCIACGGAGFLVAWLTLATSFDLAKFDSPYWDTARRVYPLPDEMLG